MSEEFISHHGVKGMKWGVRKKQAKLYKKQLNDLDKESAENISRYMRQNEKVKKYDSKARKLVNKYGDNPTNGAMNKLMKLGKKSAKATGLRDAYLEANKRAESETWKVLGKCAEEGYTVKSKQCVRFTEKGRTYCEYLLGGAIGQAIVKQKYFKNYDSQAPGMVKGNKYNVKA